MQPTSNCGERGFSLVEVLIAFAIMAAALIVLFQGFALGFRNVGGADARILALRLAQSKLDEATAAFDLSAQPASGRFDDTYSWRVVAEPYRLSAEQNSSPVLTGYWVTAEVSWRRGARAPQSVSLTTLTLRRTP